MSQRHRIVTPRVARMLRELEGTHAAPNHASVVAKPATDRGAHRRKRAALQWFKAAVAAFVPLLRGSRATR